MKTKRLSGLILLSYIAFISLGLPDGLLGVAWPGIRRHFSLPLDALGILLIFSTSGYTLSSFFSGTLVKKLGIGGLLSVSCAATATALFTYSVTPVWFLFAGAATLGGLGAGAIDAGINTYVAQNHSERMMQWLHASFGIGITAGPFIMTLGLTLFHRWQWGYAAVAAAQIVLAVTFLLTRNQWKSIRVQEESQTLDEATMGETLKKLASWMSMSLFFIYTGVEIGLGLWAYTLLTESRGISPEIAGFITGSYWGMFTIGRILAGVYSQRFKVTTLIYFSLTLALSGTLFVLLDINDFLTIAGICLTGFAVAPVFPGLVSDTENRVGRKFQGHTIGMQIAAAGVGGAVVPSLAGVLARIFGLEVIPYYLFVSILLLMIIFRISHSRRQQAVSVQAGP